MRGLLSQLLDAPAVWLEISVLLTAAPGLIWLLLKERPWPLSLRIIPLLSAFGAAAGLMIEGYRWQMVALAVLAAWLLVLDAFSIRSTIPCRRTLACVGLITLFITIVLYLGLPEISLPDATGSFAIGTLAVHLVDWSRRESLEQGNHGPRELMIQIWYPADPFLNRSPNGFSASLVERGGGKAIIGAPISFARSSYPVLIFSPSWHGERGQNFFQVRELVSHGFVVVGIDHPYGSALTTFPDGRVARAQLVPFQDLSSEKALQRSNNYIEKQLRVRVEDVEFVVAQLEEGRLEEDSNLLSRRLDLNRLGIFGYSFGGAVAAQACWRDKRFKAGIDLDGSIFGEVAEAGVRQPFLFLFEKSKPPARDELASRNPEWRRQAQLDARDIRLVRQSLAKHGGFLIGISGTGHSNFTDPPASPTIRYYLLDTGGINVDRGLRIINAYTLAFFEKYLNHSEERAFESPLQG